MRHRCPCSWRLYRRLHRQQLGVLQTEARGECSGCGLGLGRLVHRPLGLCLGLGRFLRRLVHRQLGRLLLRHLPSLRLRLRGKLQLLQLL